MSSTETQKEDKGLLDLLSPSDRQYYFDQWKHFEGAGGDDKNRMSQIQNGKNITNEKQRI